MAKPLPELAAGVPPRAPKWRDRAVAVPLAVVATLLLLLAVGAFWPMYLAKPFARIDRYTHLHAAIGLAWMALLVVQPLAILRGRLELHRGLGRLAWLAAPAFVVSAVLLAHVRFAAMDEEALAKEAFFLYLPLHTAVLFALAAGLGFAFRRTAALHARFMASTALLLIDPVIVRLLAFNLPPWPGPTSYQFLTFALTDIGFVALALSFRPRVKQARPLWIFLAAMVVAHALWFTLAPTPAWHSFAQWFRALPLT